MRQICKAVASAPKVHGALGYPNMNAKFGKSWMREPFQKYFEERVVAWPLTENWTPPSLRSFRPVAVIIISASRNSSRPWGVDT